MAFCKDIEFYRGEALTFTDQLQSLATGTNISAWNLAFTMRNAYGAANPPTVQKTTGSGQIVITDPLNWLIAITIISSDTAGLPTGLGAYVYDIARTDLGAEFVITIGRVNLLPEVRF